MGHDEDEKGSVQFWTLDPISPSGTEIHRAILRAKYVEENGVVDQLVMLDSIHVDPAHRGHGVGTAALEACLRYMQRTFNPMGTHVFLYAVPDERETPELVKEGSEQLFRFYERFGFTRIGDTDVMALGTRRASPSRE